MGEVGSGLGYFHVGGGGVGVKGGGLGGEGRRGFSIELHYAERREALCRPW